MDNRLLQRNHNDIGDTRIFSYETAYKKLNSQTAKNEETPVLRKHKKLFVLIREILDIFLSYFH